MTLYDQLLQEYARLTDLVNQYTSSLHPVILSIIDVKSANVRVLFMAYELVALVPMRANSERVKDKNIRSFAGKPLYHYIITSLLQVDEIERIVINTNIPEVIAEASTLSDKIQIIERPEHLWAGDVPMNEILLYDTERVDAKHYLQTHATNPLLKPETISKAIRTFNESDDYDSLFGVTQLQTRLYWDNGSAINHDIDVLLRTQDLPPVYEENSNLYIFDRETLQRRNNRIGYHPMMFPIERLESLDIDTMIDFEFTEFIYEHYFQI